MSLKGYPSSQKSDLGTGITNEFVTVQPSDEYRYHLDTPRFAFRVDDPLNPRTAEANTGLIDGKVWIYDTATPAKKGDFVRFDSGNNKFLEVSIVKVDGNRFQLGANLSPAPIAGDTYFIMRYATQLVDENGSQLVVSTPGPTQFVLDGLDVEVEEDTTTPANNKPLPVKLFDSGNLPFDPATETTALSIDGRLALIDASLNTIKAGASYANSVRVDYTVTNIDDTVWTEILASVGGTEIKEITLFDGGGFAMELGIGGVGAETRALLIPPGGFNGKFKLTIPASSRLSLRAVGSALVNAGELDINLFV